MLKLIGGALGSALGSIFGSLISGLFNWWRERRAINDAKKQGRTEQANVDLQKAATETTEAKNVANRVNAAGSAELGGLRDEWTR